MISPGELFTCQRCGSCCQGETTVSLDEDDLRRMGEALGLSREELFSRYLRRNGASVQMKTVDGHCIFYQQGCLVHRARPHRCAQWPLHPAILKDESNYSAIATSCPGLRGDLPYERFCRILDELLRQGDIVC